MRFEVEHRDYDLAQGGRRVELKGSPRSLAWPDLCPNCGGRASERIRVRKIFRRMQGARSRGRGWVYVIRSAEIPFCADCAARHRREEKPPSQGAVLFHVIVNPLMIPVVGGTVFGVIAFQSLDWPPSGGIRAELLGVGIVAFFAFAALWSLFSAWRSTRFMRIPPRTEVLRACDFSDNLGNVLIGERHVYAIRRGEFADAFLAANPDRVWTDADRARARRIQTVATILGVVALVAAVVLLRGL